jgi:hypothetical protein
MYRAAGNALLIILDMESARQVEFYGVWGILNSM